MWSERKGKSEKTHEKIWTYYEKVFLKLLCI